MAGLFLLLAVGALSVMLLRPVCDAAFGHAAVASTQHSSAACCDSASDGANLDDLADVASVAGIGAGMVTGAFAYPAGPSLARVVAVFASAPPPPLSYYSRSRRILR